MLKKMAAKLQNKTSRDGAPDPPRQSQLWRCPVCRRTFANRNQSHACGRSTLASHFARQTGCRARHLRQTAFGCPQEWTRHRFARKDADRVSRAHEFRGVRHSPELGRRPRRPGASSRASAVSGASKRSHREIISTRFGSRPWMRSIVKSPPGSPRPIRSASNGISVGGSHLGVAATAGFSCHRRV